MVTWCVFSGLLVRTGIVLVFKILFGNDTSVCLSLSLFEIPSVLNHLRKQGGNLALTSGRSPRDTAESHRGLVLTLARRVTGFSHRTITVDLVSFHETTSDVDRLHEREVQLQQSSKACNVREGIVLTQAWKNCEPDLQLATQEEDFTLRVAANSRLVNGRRLIT